MIIINGATGNIGRYIKSSLSSDPRTTIHSIGDNDTLLNYDDEELKRELSYASILLHLDAYGGNDNSELHNISIRKFNRMLKFVPTRCHVIYFSSCSLYKSSTQSVNSSSKIDASTKYLKSKHICELLLNEKSDWTILRLSNVVSPIMKHGVLYDWSKKYKPYDSMVIPSKNPGDVRSFIHVDDVSRIVHKLCLMIGRGSKDYSRKTYNICNDYSLSLTELAKIMELHVLGYGEDEPSIIRPDNSRTTLEIGISPLNTCNSVVRKYLDNVGYYA